MACKKNITRRSTRQLVNQYTFAVNVSCLNKKKFMHKRHDKNGSKLGNPVLKTGETLMLVCQGATLRVQSPKEILSHFDIDAPKYSEKMDIADNGYIEITFTKGYERQGSVKWLYEVDVKNKSLEAIKPCK